MTLSIVMIEKTFVYGDSFSNLEFLSQMGDILQEQMWYAPFVEGELVDRTKPGKSPFTMFLQATHDAVTERKTVRMIVALGSCERLPVYTDGWFDEEQLRDIDPDTPLPSEPKRTTLTDCERYFDRVVITKQNMHQFHPTMLWANLYKNILDLDTRCRAEGHQLVVLHMNATQDSVWVNKRHPLVRPLCERVESLPNYFDESESCRRLCEIAGITPMDASEYGKDGHHGVEGQQHFCRHMRARIRETGIWN